MTKEQIGQAVKALREKKGVRSKDLVEKGIHPSMVSIIERCKEGPGAKYSLEKLLEYLKACGITLRQVVNYKPKNK